MLESACLVIIILLQPHFTVIHCLGKIEFWPKKKWGEGLKRNTFSVYKCKYLVMRRVKDLELQYASEILSTSGSFVDYS